MIPPIADLETLPEPFELLELPPGGSARIAPTGWKLGKALIHPRDGRPPREIPVLRVTVAPADKPTLPHYWDVTAKTLIAGLLGYLEAPGAGRYEFTITKHGTAPTARFTLDTKSI